MGLRTSSFGAELLTINFRLLPIDLQRYQDNKAGACVPTSLKLGCGPAPVPKAEVLRVVFVIGGGAASSMAVVLGKKLC